MSFSARRWTRGAPDPLLDVRTSFATVREPVRGRASYFRRS
jgi:hypothetical protein